MPEERGLYKTLRAHVLTLATIYGLIGLAGRIYAGAVLRFWPKVRLRQALRSPDRRDEPAPV